MADEPTRAELELALRAAHLAIAELREDLHALAAQVVALTEVVGEGGQATEAGLVAKVEARTGELRHELAVADERSTDRLMLGAATDKYAVSAEGGPPCLELLPICGARCCSFEIPLSTQDLDEGLLRWDYARPYALAKRDGGEGDAGGDGLCVHNRAGACGVYAQRPAICRSYDCRGDARVWIDYERRQLAPRPVQPPLQRAQLEERAAARRRAMFVEVSRLRRRPRRP
jgi:Fe-S-cluster containining protein